MKAILATTVMMAMLGATSPREASACAIKDNDVAIVLGMVGDEVATLRVALHEQERDESMTDTEWSGAATLVIGATRIAIGALDPARAPEAELVRLTALARDEAKKLAGFVPATQLGQTDCADTPGSRCSVARLRGTTLRVGKQRVTVEDEVAITGVVRYRAGDATIVVVNVGTGDPRFTTSVKPCTTDGCRLIPTLHHGAQHDIVLVTRRGA